MIGIMWNFLPGNPRELEVFLRRHVFLPLSFPLICLDKALLYFQAYPTCEACQWLSDKVTMKVPEGSMIVDHNLVMN